MSPSRDFHRKRKSWARRVERCCCGALGYFPLAFVYGLLSWAAWVQISIGFWPNQGKWTGMLKPSCPLLWTLSLMLTSRQDIILGRSRTLLARRLVLYHRCLQGPWISYQLASHRWLRITPYP